MIEGQHWNTDGAAADAAATGTTTTPTVPRRRSAARRAVRPRLPDRAVPLPDANTADASPPEPGKQLQSRSQPTDGLCDGFVRAVGLTFGLAVVVVFSKWLLLPYPVSNASEFLRWALRLAIVSSADIVFVVGLAAGCGAIDVLARRRSRWLRHWRRASFVLFVAAACYALLSVAIFRGAMVPFTLRLLALAGSPQVMLSSIAPYASWPMLALIAAVPLWFWMVVRLTACLPWHRLDGSFRAALIATTLLLTAVFGTVCRAYRATHWTDPNRWERRIAQNPHWVLLASCASELFKTPFGGTSLVFAEGDTSDFSAPHVPAAHTVSTAVSPAGPLTEAERPRNVIYIVIESLSAEYLRLYGGPHEVMPRLARRASRNGVVFENAYVQAASSCKTLLSLTASVYPRPDWCYVVRDCPQFDVPTVQQVLQRHGYRTCYLHSGPWKWKHRDRFLRPRGVDRLIDADTLPGPAVSSWGVSDRVMFQAGLDWIDAQPEQPFFLFAYTIETHHPYVSPETPIDFGVDDQQFNRYLNAARETDRKIDWFLSELAARGLDRSTLVVVTADHGESFGQHNQRVHNFSIYQHAVHVPLVMLHASLRRSFGLPPRERRVCQHIDVSPTVLDALGIAAPPVWQGRSLLRPGGPHRAYFLATGNQVVLGLRDGPWKYHYYVDSDRDELFHLPNDPHERLNLADRHPERSAHYRHRVIGLVQFQRKFLATHGGL